MLYNVLTIIIIIQFRSFEMFGLIEITMRLAHRHIHTNLLALVCVCVCVCICALSIYLAVQLYF